MGDMPIVRVPTVHAGPARFTSHKLTSELVPGEVADVTYARADASVVSTCGQDTYNQLGDGSAAGGSVASPPDVGWRGSLYGKVVDLVDSGWDHILAVDADGRLHAWGRDLEGQITGVGQKNVAVEITGAGDMPAHQTPLGPTAFQTNRVDRIAAERYVSFAVIDGDLYGWGQNPDGSGTTFSSPKYIPSQGWFYNGFVNFIKTSGLTHWAIGYGSYEGWDWAWGDNTYGQFGNGNTTASAVPVRAALAIPSGQVVEIGLGDHHVVARLNTGDIYTWGRNQHSQIGNGTNSTSPTLTPTKINTFGALNGKSIRQVVASRNHSYAVTTDGQLIGWGEATYGLGPGTASTVPVRINSGSLVGKFVEYVETGQFHSHAVTSDGRTHGWGYNASGYGMIGDGTYTYRPTPVLVVGVPATYKTKSMSHGYFSTVFVGDT